MWYRSYEEVIGGVVRPGKEITWEDDKLRADLEWTRTVLVMVHTLGQHIVPDCDPSAIETPP